MKSLTITTLFILLLHLCLVAQNNPVTLNGTIVDQTNNLPIPYATVLVSDKSTEQMISGSATGEDGSFKVQSNSSDIIVKVSFMGFETKTISDISIQNGSADLGTITLNANSQVLDEIKVVGEKSSMEFELDKRVFNVGNDISSTGMSALEVLNNVPSVNVDIEGQISLRGNSGVQMLINGKPSVMTDERSNALGTITADMIERIEVITNPSAKYDAEGTAGILNIVLKKEENKGLNGSITANTGLPENHSVGLSMNKRTDKFNLFTQLGAGYRSLPRDSETRNLDRINQTTLFSNGTSYRNETFFNLTLGTDYHIDDNNVITLSGNYAYEIENQPSRTNYSLLDENNQIVSEWYRQETTDAGNPKWQYDLQYSKEFDNNENHLLLLSALGSFFGKEQSSMFSNTVISGPTLNPDQQTETTFQQADYTFKADYTNPISELFTIETGGQYLINDVGNDYSVSNFEDGEWIVDNSLTNLFEYDQRVLAGYGTGSYKGDKWGLKLGIRVENTDLHTLLTNTNENNIQRYTDFFPSIHSSYNLTENVSLQAGYSRRIYRPRLWDLNPFFNIRDNYNIRAGNPNLRPEYSDSYELTSIFKLGKASLNASIFHLFTSDMVERVITSENNVRTSMPLNVGTNRATGLEINGKYVPVNWLTFNGDFNWNFYNRRGDYEGQSFDFNGNRWSTRLMSKFELPADFALEITGDYESGYESVQSDISESVSVDIGLRKKINKGKFVINAGIRDLFNTSNRESITDQATYYVFSRQQRRRAFTLGISYGFGKGEAMTYSGGRRH